MSILRMTGTQILRRNLAATTRFVCNEGGARSSKTTSIAQKYILKALQTTGKVFTISRKTGPSMTSSVMRDFFDLLKEYGLYSSENHNKSEKTYILHGNIFEFLSMDDPQKKRGAKRNFLWLNESNEFTYEDFTQLNLRTTEEITLDYNPSDEYHWIYDRVIPRKDCTLIKSTYRDNPFLPQSLVKELEMLQGIDPNYWSIYGLGERAVSTSTIYTKWDIVQALPESFDDFVFGIDFGFNNPSVLLGVAIKDIDIYLHEFIYEKGLTNQAFIQRMFEIVPEQLRMKLMKADSAEPDRIQEIFNAGFNIVPAKKGHNSVKDGIDVLKRARIHITASSVNTIKEVKGYKWKINKDGHVLDEPVNFMNHSMDAARYAAGLDTEPVEKEESVFPDDVGIEIENVQIGQNEESVLMR